MKKDKLTLKEWEEIGNKAKEINNSQFELLKMLSGKLPKKDYLKKWDSANKSFGKLRSHLDNIVCGLFTDLPDNEITSIFYGDKKQ